MTIAIAASICFSFFFLSLNIYENWFLIYFFFVSFSTVSIDAIVDWGPNWAALAWLFASLSVIYVSQCSDSAFHEPIKLSMSLCHIHISCQYTRRLMSLAVLPPHLQLRSANILIWVRVAAWVLDRFMNGHGDKTQFGSTQTRNTRKLAYKSAHAAGQKEVH